MLEAGNEEFVEQRENHPSLPNISLIAPVLTATRHRNARAETTSQQRAEAIKHRLKQAERMLKRSGIGADKGG